MTITRRDLLLMALVMAVTAYGLSEWIKHDGTTFGPQGPGTKLIQTAWAREATPDEITHSYTAVSNVSILVAISLLGWIMYRLDNSDEDDGDDEPSADPPSSPAINAKAIINAE